MKVSTKIKFNTFLVLLLCFMWSGSISEDKYVSYRRHPEYLNERQKLYDRYNSQIAGYREELEEKLRDYSWENQNLLYNNLVEYNRGLRKIYAEYGGKVRPFKEELQDKLFELRRTYRRKYPVIENTSYGKDPEYIQRKETIVSNYEDLERKVRKDLKEIKQELWSKYLNKEITYQQYKQLYDEKRASKVAILGEMKTETKYLLDRLREEFKAKYPPKKKREKRDYREYISR